MRGRLSSWLCTCLLALCTLAATSSSSARPVKVVVECDEEVWFQSLDVAEAQVGVVEKSGRNDGPQVAGYLGSVGLREGNPWCYAVHYWSFTQVTDRPPLKRTGLVRAAWNDALKRGTIVPYKVEVGDFLVWGYATSTSGHIERINSKEQRGGWVETLAGNSLKPGARGSERDGGGFYKKYRNIRHPLGKMFTKGLIGRKTPRERLDANDDRVS